MNEETNVTFEEAMIQLDNVVKQLENNEIGLEEAMNLYQNGVKLAALCEKQLKNAEEKMVQLVQADGEKTDFEMKEPEA
ncbi:Exodeoxyribonuclease 7 small subunit [Brochothrix thermosphacta]|uniref:exodeoxyribonuclease VII small subunit n=1 Tax=Brochothrix thermosphacta TaxID=2756 RepID=UPI000D11382C|nr:exodeoxyribonuclease VII small subunit [Brochothrix thermosphacta]SOC32565.1 Exodeoxyribonuclease 7 small subunit [Brochothrix thermosphacta]